MGFPFNSDLSQPYYGGSGGSTTLVPFNAEVALGGHPYRIDWASDVPLNYIGPETLRPQADQSDAVGEQSLSREAYWRRATETWHVGAGQRHYDRPESNPNRFFQSKGINVWTKFQFSLLKETLQELASASTNLRAVIAGDHLYLTDGTDIKFWTNVTGGTFTSLTGEPGVAATSIATNGFHIWTAHAASGIYRTTRGGATTASHITGDVDLVAFVRGRVLAAKNNLLYDVSSLAVGASGALPAAFYTHGNTDFDWIGFAESSSWIYAGGVSGVSSLIYKIGLNTDSAALDAPIVAAELPVGEILTSLYSYLGKFVLVGTNKGWRFAIASDAGDLQLGALVSTPSSVRAFVGVGEFVWFGWGNFDGASTGVGRLNTSIFSDLDNLVPAYASDLMVEGQTANILSIVSFQDRIMFTVDGVGLYYEGTNLVEEGFIDSGLINYNIVEPKIGLFLEAQHTGTVGEHEVAVSVNMGSFVSLGAHEAETIFNLGQVEGKNFEIRNILHRDPTTPTLGLVVHSWLLRVQPKPSLTDYISSTILIAEQVESLQDAYIYYDTWSELEYITNLYRTKEITAFQWGERSDTVVLERYELMVHEVMEGQEGTKGFNVSCRLEMKRLF